MDLRVRNFRDEELTFPEIDPNSTTVAQLKELVRSNFEFPSPNVCKCMVFAQHGKEFHADDEDTLDMAGIDCEHVLFVFITMAPPKSKKGNRVLHMSRNKRNHLVLIGQNDDTGFWTELLQRAGSKSCSFYPFTNKMILHDADQDMADTIAQFAETERRFHVFRFDHQWTPPPKRPEVPCPQVDEPSPNCGKTLFLEKLFSTVFMVLMVTIYATLQ